MLPFVLLTLTWHNNVGPNGEAATVILIWRGDGTCLSMNGLYAMWEIPVAERYEDLTADPAKQYCYAVQAFNGEGHSGWDVRQVGTGGPVAENVPTGGGDTTPPEPASHVIVR
jgi:hypothetical protein